ncbi:MAG: SNF2-related protein, partial [Pirellulales bacterium]|nr:SNF2-related protein [Pirellulales bacterium]
MWFGRRRNVEPYKPESVSQAVEVISWNRNVGDAPESLTPPVDFFTTGWNSAIARSPRVDSDDVNLFASQPQVVSLSVRHPKVQVRGFRFPESAQWSSFMLADSQKPVSPVSGSRAQRRKKTRRRDGDLPQATRMQPPKDIVKLEDRLYYLLQPPLESIIASASLRFPFEPFPYQYEGVAFLFPRFEAVLADEMGLGKTMQAITTIRMLLVSGQLRRILLVCPKPLVSNWLREFATWAPEIPIAAIEGDQKRREWQWRQHEPAVRVANYELVVRDHMFVSEEGNHFDLVVLDEAQRIKNKSNTTSQVIRGVSRSRSWALTGTPVENSPDDLVGLFEFLSPGYLHTGMPVPRMAELVGDFVLRRTKDMVMTELTPMMYRDEEISLRPEQWST